MLMVLLVQTSPTRLVRPLFWSASHIFVTSWEKLATPLSFKHSRALRMSGPHEDKLTIKVLLARLAALPPA
jgi:hypothetical protein